jgi:hypothetical protein
MTILPGKPKKIRVTDMGITTVLNLVADYYRGVSRQVVFASDVLSDADVQGVKEAVTKSVKESQRREIAQKLYEEERSKRIAEGKAHAEEVQRLLA